MAVGKLTKTSIETAIAQRLPVILWDTTTKGFGAKVSDRGICSFIVQYRLPGGRRGRTRRVTIGRFGGPWTVELARQRAKEILGEAVLGSDPADKKAKLGRTVTVSQLCDRYLSEGTATKKASTLRSDRGRINRHIKVLLGNKLITEITRTDVRRFLKDVSEGKTAVVEKTGFRGKAVVRGGKGTATRTVGLLGGIFSFAVDDGLIVTNPVTGVERHKDRRNQRFLTLDDIRTLGEALRVEEENGANPEAIAIVKLLLLTGARRGEVEGLKWSEVDFARSYLCLEDSKTGQKLVRLSEPALAILRNQHVRSSSSPWVFPSRNGLTHFSGTRKIWLRVIGRTNFSGLRIHDLRHSFATIGVELTKSLPHMSGLLGHGNYSTTQQYLHLLDDSLWRATRETGSAIEKALGP
ncbi:MAG: tyrosine-type recombinase/integrase [Rhizobiaceae bacterium]|nr:tyrosine-type recombinase/integrase [Rhizobiaceae bacterium]